jgi:cobaltochelatase CobS
LLGLDASASFTFKATAAAVPATEYDFSGVLANGILKLLAVCDATQSHLWISGERGTGKTALVEALAKSTGRNFYRLAHSQQMECADYIGTRVFDDEGAMVWADGLLTTALRDPCAIIAIDEPSLNPAACQMYQTILDQRYLNIPATGERVNLQPDQLIIALDNTSGDGDQSGAYHGTAPVNIAFMDRFAFIAKASYMPMAAEAKLLERYCSAAQAHAIALYAQAVRSAVADGTVEQTVSYRRLEALAILIGSGVPQNTALVTAIFNHVNHADDEEFYRQLAGATLDLNN